MRLRGLYWRGKVSKLIAAHTQDHPGVFANRNEVRGGVDIVPAV